VSRGGIHLVDLRKVDLFHFHVRIPISLPSSCPVPSARTAAIPVRFE
jgi:hypothetical protein